MFYEKPESNIYFPREIIFRKLTQPTTAVVLGYGHNDHDGDARSVYVIWATLYILTSKMDTPGSLNS